MGLFGFGKKQPEENVKQLVPTETPVGNEVSLDLSKGRLNLKKGDFLNLTKSEVPLSNIKVGVGWDVARGMRVFDLDLYAALLNEKGGIVKKVYFGNLSEPGIKLSGDNLTGAGDGDDETIYLDFNKIPQNISKVVFSVIIYRGKDRHQHFSDVSNAYVSLTDESASHSQQLVRYDLSSNGGDNTAVKVAEIHKTTTGWIFKPLEIYSKDTIDSLTF